MESTWGMYTNKGVGDKQRVMETQYTQQRDGSLYPYLTFPSLNLDLCLHLFAISDLLFNVIVLLLLSM